MSSQFLLSKSKDIGPKLVMAQVRSRKEGARHLLPGDNRSAVCKWTPEKGRKKRKEH